MRYIYDFDDSCNVYYTEHLKRDSNISSMQADHCHEGYEFYFYLGDGMTYLIDSESYVVNKHDLIFIDKNIYHRTIYKTNKEERILFSLRTELFSCLCDSSEVFSAIERISKTPKMTFDDETKRKILNLIYDIVDGDVKENNLSTKLKLISFILEIDNFIRQDHLCFSDSSEHKDESKVTEVMDYLLKNYTKKITLETLEKEFFISKYHLCRKFKEATGQTIVSFINEKRLAAAKHLLISSDRSVLDIATQAGFDSVNHFNNLFKKKYGTTPYKYKQKMRRKVV